MYSAGWKLSINQAFPRYRKAFISIFILASTNHYINNTKRCFGRNILILSRCNVYKIHINYQFQIYTLQRDNMGILRPQKFVGKYLQSCFLLSVEGPKVYLDTRNVTQNYMSMLIRQMLDQDLLYMAMYDMGSERLYLFD